MAVFLEFTQVSGPGKGTGAQVVQMCRFGVWLPRQDCFVGEDYAPRQVRERRPGWNTGSKAGAMMRPLLLRTTEESGDADQRRQAGSIIKQCQQAKRKTPPTGGVF